MCVQAVHDRYQANVIHDRQRLIERGVRARIASWQTSAAAAAALLTDRQPRGLLDDTLVIGGREFGRRSGVG